MHGSSSLTLPASRLALLSPRPSQPAPCSNPGRAVNGPATSRRPSTTRTGRAGRLRGAGPSVTRPGREGRTSTDGSRSRAPAPRRETLRPRTLCACRPRNRRRRLRRPAPACAPRGWRDRADKDEAIEARAAAHDARVRRHRPRHSRRRAGRDVSGRQRRGGGIADLHQQVAGDRVATIAGPVRRREPASSRRGPGRRHPAARCGEGYSTTGGGVRACDRDRPLAVPARYYTARLRAAPTIGASGAWLCELSTDVPSPAGLSLGTDRLSGTSVPNRRSW